MHIAVATSANVFSSEKTASLGRGERKRTVSGEPSSRIGYRTLKPPMINGGTKRAGLPYIFWAQASILRHVDENRTDLFARSDSSSLKSQATLPELCLAL